MPTSILPQLTGRPFITDGGLESSLVDQYEVDLPESAAFPLIDEPWGRDVLTQYFLPYLEVAEHDERGFILDTPTGRANPDWGARLGYDDEQLIEVNRNAVRFIRDLCESSARTETVLNGVIGARADGYAADQTMTVDEAAVYHSGQARAFAEARADMITAVTMTYAEEAIGITKAATAVAMPVVIGFTVDVEGRLPSGQRLGDAIGTVDGATEMAPAYFMINNAHPSHFAHVLDKTEPWLSRIRAIRAKASRLGKGAVGGSAELDRCEPDDLATAYRNLDEILPGLCVVGGCSGTTYEHIAAISAAL